MEIKVSTENARVPVTVIHLDGNLDAATSNEFLKKAQEVIEGGARYILVDLAHTPYVSSAGFRVIHQMFKDLNAIHPDANVSEDDMKKGVSAGSYKSPYLKLVNLSSDTRAVFTTTGFDMYIEDYGDLKTAIASF